VFLEDRKCGGLGGAALGLNLRDCRLAGRIWGVGDPIGDVPKRQGRVDGGVGDGFPIIGAVPVLGLLKASDLAAGLCQQITGRFDAKR